jgi:hypothetical protein
VTGSNNKNTLGGLTGFSLYPVHACCVFVSFAGASFVSHAKPTKNISSHFTGMPLQSLPRRREAKAW